MSGYQYLFCCSEFCIGALVGASAVKGASSLRTGLAVTLLLGTGAIVELIVIDELRHNRRPGSIVAYVIGSLGFFLVPLWARCLLFACVGYLMAFWAAGVNYRLRSENGIQRVRRAQFSISTILALIALYGVVAAIGSAIE